MADYIHDIFVSYHHSSKEWIRWTKQNIVDPLEALLEPRFEKPVSIYTDQRLQIGAKWPPELARNLAQSKLMVAILSRAYFHSDWCRLELGLMFKREQLTGTPENPSRLIIPVIIDDGDSFPSEVQAMQGALMHEFANPYIVIGSRKQQRLTEFLRQQICPAIESALLRVPPCDPNWEDIAHEQAQNLFRLKIQNKMTMPSISPL